MVYKYDSYNRFLNITHVPTMLTLKMYKLGHCIIPSPQNTTSYNKGM